MKNNIIPAIIIAIGLGIIGRGIYAGISHIADNERTVSVKGLSTRDVQADHAVWPLTFSVSGNNLQDLYKEMSNVEQTVTAFLEERGFQKADISRGNTSVNNNWDSYYGQRPEHHYTLSGTIVVSTKDVERVRQNNGCQSELLQRGIILNSNEWSLNYEFAGLNELKPEMIEEATKNARAVAEKFAADAECDLGSIRNASQGQFSVESDQYQPWIKHVRVVTTITYLLD